MMKTGWLTVALALLLAACASSPESQSSGVTGTVLAGPQCPVERADSPCPDRPVVDAVVVALDAEGNVVGTDSSDQDGHFGIYLAPGQYRIVVQNLHGIQSSKPATVRVESNRYSDVTLLVDTGIR
jgi:hypothetical protein